MRSRDVATDVSECMKEMLSVVVADMESISIMATQSDTTKASSPWPSTVIEDTAAKMDPLADGPKDKVEIESSYPSPKVNEYDGVTAQQRSALEECMNADMESISIMATQSDTTKASSPSTVIEDTTAKIYPSVNPSADGPKDKVEIESSCPSPKVNEYDGVTAQQRSALEELLPHEGPRWARLRDKIAIAPQFQTYAAKIQKDAEWNPDEAFVSFLLDRLEEDFDTRNPRQTGVQKSNKKATRRKGKPRKYEGTQSMYFDEEFEDDDVLSMDDNPNDLDYEPVSIIRYKRTPSRRLPRRNSTRRSTYSDEVTMVAMEIGDVNNIEGSDSSVEVKRKLSKPSKPRKKAQTPKTSKPNDRDAPQRKRGRPRKNPNEKPKVRGKVGRPRIPEEVKLAKRRAYNESRRYTRLEVALASLPKLLRCRSCSTEFPETADMKLHYLTVHQQQEVKELDRKDPSSAFNKCRITDIATILRECTTCKEYVENMTRHNRKHQSYNFICEECGKFFVNNVRLKLHMRVHTMDRTGERLQCDKCDKSYRCPSSLQRHQLIHAGKKTYICDQCGKDFFNSIRLRIHRAIHMKEKPYKCLDCGRGFTQRTNLRSHQRVHTGVKPYKCDLCQDTFTHKVSLKMHKKKKHGIDWWKENGIYVEDRSPTRKRSPTKKPVVKNSTEKVLMDMQTLADHQQMNSGEAERNYEFMSSLITHGSKTYAQLERRSNASEILHTMVNPFNNPWHS